MKLIITCGCNDTAQFAKDAFRILFPKDKYDRIEENPDVEFLVLINNYLMDYVGELVDFDKPYALLLDDGGYNIDMNKHMISIYNLLRGYKIC